MSIADANLLTIEQFAKLPDNNRPTELVRGRVIEMNPPTPRHGQICAQVGRIVGNFVEEQDIGHVASNDAGIITQRDPDTLRGADVAYYSYSRVPKGPFPEGYLQAPPDLVFEVLSEEDRWPKVLGKVAEYLAAGVRVVCVLDPKRQTARLFDAHGSDQILSVDDDLTFPDILPDFRVRVGRFYQ